MPESSESYSPAGHARRMTALEIGLARSLAALGVGGPTTLVTLVVGVSGGADSISLLDGLWRWRAAGRAAVRLVVAHLNHLLRGDDSDQDEAFVIEVAEKYGLPCVVERSPIAELARAERRNLEATARERRYQFLQRVAADWHHGEQIVCTAHTADDQAETVLMHLLRGSGISGLAGIPLQRRLGEDTRLIRPLLEVTRAEVLAHGEHYGLEYRTDQTNHSTDLRRNRIRHELLVSLRTYNPAITATLVRTAALLREDDAFLQELSHEYRQGVTVSDPDHDSPAGSLRIEPLRALPRAIRRRVVRDWIAAARGGLERISASHLAAVEQLLDTGQSGQRTPLPGGAAIVRVFETLNFQPAGSLPAPSRLPVTRLPAGVLTTFGRFQLLLHPSPDPNPFPAPFPAGGAPGWMTPLGRDEIEERLLIRTREPGDIIRPSPGCHRIKLKTLMIRHKIPGSKRDTWPVVMTEAGRLVWIPGAPAALAPATPGTPGEWQPQGWLFAAEMAK
jgi:tRNA(Ile)-lysidine synthase